MPQNATSAHTPPYLIFLSHAGEDKETIARPLWRRLDGHGLSVFLDDESFDLSDHSPNVMIDAMETAPIGIFIMSPEFIAKEWTMRELLAFVRRYKSAVDAGETPPSLIPVFYRLVTRECRDPDIFETYGSLFNRHGLIKRALDDIIPLKHVKDALNMAATLWSIRNDCGATNDMCPGMATTREFFIETIENKILNLPEILGSQVVERHYSVLGDQSAQRDKYIRCNMVQPNSSNIMLEYSSPVTFEGMLRAAVLRKSERRGDIVVACGEGGVGKTCAMRGLAYDEKINSQFDGGILYIELGIKAAISNVVQGIAEIVDRTGGSNLANVIRTAKSVLEACQEASKWFGQRSCLFLVDDIWNVNEIDSDVLTNLVLMVNTNSRMVYTTREAHFLTEATEEIEFKAKEPLGTLSRQMLLKHAGFKQNSELDRENQEAFEYFLEFCQGLPLGFSIVGSSVRQCSRYCKPKQNAWSEFYKDLSSNQKDWMKSKAGSYGEPSRIVDLPLQVLETRRRDGKFGYWFRALSVIQKEQSVPLQMLQNLWDLDTPQETQSVAESFADVSLVQMARTDGSIYVKLHGLVLEIAVRKAIERGEIAMFFQTLVRNYMSSHGMNERSEPPPWWDTKDDGYIYNNLCQILRSAGYDEQLLRLLSQPQWIVMRLVKGGILNVEEDLDHGKAVCKDNSSRQPNHKEHLQMIGKAARLSASSVSKNPRLEEAWFQLHGRLLWHATKNKLTEDFVQRMERYAPKPWLKASASLLQQAGGSALQGVSVPGDVLCTRLEPDAIWILSEDVYTNVMHVGKYESSTERYTYEKLGNWEEWARECVCASFLPDLRRVMTAHRDGTVCVWDRQTGVRELIIAPDCANHERFVDFYADGTGLACGIKDFSIQLWDTLSCEPVGQPLRGHTDWVECVAATPDRTVVVTGSCDCTVRVWNTQTSNLVGQVLAGHTASVQSVAVNAKGTHIASGSYDRMVRIWDAERGVAVGLVGHTRPVTCVSLSDDGNRIISGSEDNTVRVWDARIGKAVGQPLQGHTDTVRCVSTDGTRIISGSRDNTVRVWDAQIGHAGGHPLSDHAATVLCVVMSADGNRIVSGFDDGTVCVWNAQMGNAVGQPLQCHTCPVRVVAVNANGTSVVSGDGEILRLWELNASGGECVLTSHDAAWQSTIENMELTSSRPGWEPFEREVYHFAEDGSRIVLGSCEDALGNINDGDVYFTKYFRSCRLVRGRDDDD